MKTTPQTTNPPTQEFTKKTLQSSWKVAAPARQLITELENSDNPGTVALTKRLNQVGEAATKVSAAEANVQKAESELESLIGSLGGVSQPSANMRRMRLSVPPSQVSKVYSNDLLLKITQDFIAGYKGRDVRWAGAPDKRVMYLDVRRYLDSQVDAAYELLAKHAELMREFVQPGEGVEALAHAVRSDHIYNVCMMRASYLGRLHSDARPYQSSVEESSESPGCDADGNPLFADLLYPKATSSSESGGTADGIKSCKCDESLTSLEALSWAIMVHAALLNDRLVEDMTTLQQSKGCLCNNCGALDYYLPEPSAEARQSFNEYVACRWPIRVFAVDPVAQQQNVLDAFSLRREQQFALTLAFASGEINANTLTQYARRIEYDFERIELNQTILGFSHGENVFGWRMYPRVQPPPIQGSVTALGQTIFGGPTRNGELRKQRLEDGQRELTALVLMPSFVPYVDFHTRSNWFRLTKHHGIRPHRQETEMSMQDTVMLSRSIKSMETLSCLTKDNSVYQDGTVTLLRKRIDQLAKEVPIQTMRVQVPVENTLSGFELFRSGVTDLAPELFGWHGAPGVAIDSALAVPQGPLRRNGDHSEASPENAPLGTTLFLIGDNFSVHDTQIIAGGRRIDDVQLISRQIARVGIPSTVQTVVLDNEEYVAIHVATPYGVTAHLHVPAVRYNPPVVEAVLPPPNSFSLVENGPLTVLYRTDCDLPMPFGSFTPLPGSESVTVKFNAPDKGVFNSAFNVPNQIHLAMALGKDGKLLTDAKHLISVVKKTNSQWSTEAGEIARLLNVDFKADINSLLGGVAQETVVDAVFYLTHDATEGGYDPSALLDRNVLPVAVLGTAPIVLRPAPAADGCPRPAPVTTLGTGKQNVNAQTARRVHHPMKPMKVPFSGAQGPAIVQHGSHVLSPAKDAERSVTNNAPLGPGARKLPSTAQPAPAAAMEHAGNNQFHRLPPPVRLSANATEQGVVSRPRR